MQHCAAATGVLRWPPSEFWAATPQEFWAAWELQLRLYEAQAPKEMRR
ncbi:phage tail assembly chaperone [Pseudaestuariivita rosea]|nr:phage tail assembly chaperone [Pseudaestuariivita rosea]